VVFYPLPLLKNLKLLKIQGMDNLNIEAEEESGQHRQSCA
jgi:hypothetical protein